MTTFFRQFISLRGILDLMEIISYRLQMSVRHLSTPFVLSFIFVSTSLLGLRVLFRFSRKLGLYGVHPQNSFGDEPAEMLFC